MVKEHPILFSPPMVKAILKGIKTMTRRLPGIRNTLVDGVHVSQKGWNSYLFNFNTAYIDNGPSPAGNPGPYLKVPSKIFETVHRVYPIYQPGDWLWVRETFQHCLDDECQPTGTYFYQASETGQNGIGWKPGIHMPKDAARIWLEVVHCYPERIQEITNEDAIKEGTRIIPVILCDEDVVDDKFMFNWLWNDMHPGSWINNDWVWVTEFKVLSTSGKPLFKKLTHIHA